MTTPPPYRLARHETTTHITVTDPAALDPVNGGTVRNPRPMRPNDVEVRTRDGHATFVAVNGRRVLKRDKDGGPASGARLYQSFGVRDHVVQPAWGEVDPPDWLQGLYDAWRTNNLVDGRL